MAGAVIELDDHAHTRRLLPHRHHALLDEGHHLVPLPLDVREHGVRLVGQAAGPDEGDSVRHGAAHRVTGAERGDEKAAICAERPAGS